MVACCAGRVPRYRVIRPAIESRAMNLVSSKHLEIKSSIG